MRNINSELLDKIDHQLRIGMDFSRDINRTVDTPYTTVVHRDLWLNNIMIKKGNNKSN